MAKLLAKFDTMSLLESFRHFRRKQQCDARCVYTLTHTLGARDWRCLLAGKKPTNAHEGSLHLPSKAHLSCFVGFRGKKITSNTFWTGHVYPSRFNFTQFIYIWKLLYMFRVVRSSNSSTIAAGRSNGVTNTRCCRYSCMLLMLTKGPTRCNSTQTFIYCRVTLHVSGVTAPIIRSTKNCICYLWYKSWYWYRYFLPPCHGGRK